MKNCSEAPALYIDNSLNHARSDKCQTFNSPALSNQIDFQIIKMEIWAAKFD